jgi:polysaccharide biosynthesis protein PslE
VSPNNDSGNVLRDFSNALFRHKRQSALFFGVVVTGTVLWTLLVPREYRSECKLFVRLGRENAMLDPTATPGQNPTVAVPQSRESEINSVVEILQSRVLLERVVDGLGAASVLGATSQRDPAGQTPTAEASNGWIQIAGARIGQVCDVGKSLLRQFTSSAQLDDRERAIQFIAKKIAVEAAKKSNVVEVSYDGPSPANSQAVVAKLIDCYLDEHVRLNRAHGSHEFFDDQTRRLHNELSHKEIELRDLKNQTGLASPSAQRQLIVARLGRLQDDLLSAEAAQAVAQAKVRDLRSKLASLPDTQVANETSGFNNEGTDRMRDQFYALQVREKEAQAKYTDDHPKLRQIHDQVARSKAILDEEERGRKQVTKEPGRLHQQAELTLLAEEPTLASWQAHAHELRTQLAGVHKELAALNDNEMRVASLQREVDLLEADYRKYSNSLEQARIDQQLEAQRMSNIGIVQPASYEPRPVRPRAAMNLLLGICVGLFGALALPLALDQFEDSPRMPEGVEERLAPTLATIPRLKSRRLHFNGKSQRDEAPVVERLEPRKAK